MLLDVVRVEAQPDHTLLLEFENGECRLRHELIADRRPFDRLKNARLLAVASVDYGTVVWPGNIDIAPRPCTTGRPRWCD